MVLRRGEPVPGGHDGDQHLEHVVAHDRGADGEHHVDDDEFPAAERKRGARPANGSVRESHEDHDEDDVEEEGDGRDVGAVAADGLQVEHPERVQRQQYDSKEKSSPQAGPVLHAKYLPLCRPLFVAHRSDTCREADGWSLSGGQPQGIQLTSDRQIRIARHVVSTLPSGRPLC